MCFRMYNFNQKLQIRWVVVADGWEVVEDAETISIHVYVLPSTHVDVPTSKYTCRCTFKNPW